MRLQNENEKIDKLINEKCENFVKQAVKSSTIVKPSQEDEENGTKIMKKSTVVVEDTSPPQAFNSYFLSHEFLNIRAKYEDDSHSENEFYYTNDNSFDIFNELSLKIRNHYNNYILTGEEDPWVNKHKK